MILARAMASWRGVIGETSSGMTTTSTPWERASSSSGPPLPVTSVPRYR